MWDARYDIHHDSFFTGSAGLRWRQGIRHYLQRADLDGSIDVKTTVGDVIERRGRPTKTWLRQLFVKISRFKPRVFVKGLYPNLACLKVRRFKPFLAFLGR